MAIDNPPAYLQAGTYTASRDRLHLISARMGPTTLNLTDVAARGGILPGQSSRQATFSMSTWDVSVGRFIAVVENTFGTTVGDYQVMNTATQVLTVTASSPTTNRIDIIGVRIQDAFYSGALNQGDLVVVQGTPSAGAPSDPALPSSFLPIVRVTVSAASSTGTLTDLRKRTNVAGATYAPYAGQLTDAGTFVGETQVLPAAGVYPQRMRVWDGSVWKGTTPWAFTAGTQSGSGNILTGASLVMSTISVADPGYAYRLIVSGQLEWNISAASSPGNLISLSSTLDSAVYNVGEMRRAYMTSASIGGGFSQPTLAVSPTPTGSLTGAHDIRLIAHNFAAITVTAPAAAIGTGLTVELVPA